MQIRGNLVRELTGEWKTGDLESSDQKDDSSCGPFTLMVIIETNALKLSNRIEIFHLKLGALSEMNNIYDKNHVDHALIIAKEAVLYCSLC